MMRSKNADAFAAVNCVMNVYAHNAALFGSQLFIRRIPFLTYILKIDF